MKNDWIDQLRNLISERVRLQVGKSQQRELAAPLMIPDDWSSTCMLKSCGKNFSAFNRRHHCRYCGQLVCGKCASYKLASKMDSNKIVKRVCKQCYDTYHGKYEASESGVVEDDSSASDEEQEQDEQKDDK
jgi:hypothetical protein